jgi:hypothetical protein
MVQSATQAHGLGRFGRCMDKASRARMQRGFMFGGCLNASLAKCKELCVDAHAKKEPRTSFFLVPSLRDANPLRYPDRASQVCGSHASVPGGESRSDFQCVALASIFFQPENQADSNLTGILTEEKRLNVAG